jgi:hypothetical protein
VHAPGARNPSEPVNIDASTTTKNVLPDSSLILKCSQPSVKIVAPLMTRSKKTYQGFSPPTHELLSLSFASPTLLGCMGKMLGKLLDSHPLFNKHCWHLLLGCYAPHICHPILVPLTHLNMPIVVFKRICKFQLLSWYTDLDFFSKKISLTPFDIGFGMGLSVVTFSSIFFSSTSNFLCRFVDFQGIQLLCTMKFPCQYHHNSVIV